MSEVTKKWYVVRAISGKEKRVKEYLEIEMGRMKALDENIDQVLIPTEKIFQIRNGKKVNKERAYLPGYVLIEAALVGEVKHVIRSIPNVIGFLGTEKGGEPVPMRMSEYRAVDWSKDTLEPSLGLLLLQPSMEPDKKCLCKASIVAQPLGFKGGLFGIHTCCIHYRPSI